MRRTGLASIFLVLGVHCTNVAPESTERDESASVGRDPNMESPMAVTTSFGMPIHSNIVNVMKHVADVWTNAHPIPNQDWDRAVHFWGLTELYRIAGDTRYFHRVHDWGEANRWQPLSTKAACSNPLLACDTVTDADHSVAGMAYWEQMTLSDASARTSNIEPSIAAQRSTLYPWIDLFFMGFPLSARYGQAHADSSYFDGIWRNFSTARDVGVGYKGLPPSGPLYSTHYRLWNRDNDFAGSTVFWGRGNGWVIAALASVLEYLPASDPHRADYVQMARTLATSMLAAQRSDGFLVSSLVPTPGYNSTDPETTSTALLTFALAKLVRLGHLDAATYLPRAAHAWSGMITKAVQPDGTLGYCQGSDFRPAKAAIRATDTSWTCVGVFLLAGTELAKLEPNFARGGTVRGSAEQPGNEAARAVDGDITTRWSATPFPQRLTVDLGAMRTVSNVSILPRDDRLYRFEVDVSVDRTTWSKVYGASHGVLGSRHVSFKPAQARAVRLTVTGVEDGFTTWASILEFGVYDGY